jgi:hypothetical protein
MAEIDFSPDERGELVKLLRATIAADRFPLSPRIRNLKSVLAKLDPSSVPQPSQSPKSQPWPPPKDW